MFGRNQEDPLESRSGMIGEVLNSAEFYPTIFVVVDHVSQISPLQKQLSRLAGKIPAISSGHSIIMPKCCVHFGTVEQVERFRGTIPVFYDPIGSQGMWTEDRAA